MDHWTVAMLGDGGVGKTAIAVQFVYKSFVRTYDPTIEDSYRKPLNVDEKIANIQILDTAGQDTYASLLDQWIREGQGFVLVYSVSNRASLDKLDPFWRQITKIKKGRTPPLVVVGNKADKHPSEREVSKTEGMATAKKFGALFLETSAKTGQNVDRLFTEIVRMLREAKARELGIPVHPPPRKDIKKGCVVV